MFQGYIMLLREGGYDLLERDPDAYMLLSQIALRARRFDDQYGSMPLKANQALIGDHKKLKLSRDRYRRATNRLEKYGIATFQSTNKGTIATLIDTTVFDINANDSASTFSIKAPSTLSMKNLETTPSNHHQETNKTPSNNHQKSIQQPLTRMKEGNKETTTTSEAVAPLYECLLDLENLSSEEKQSLMQYPEDRVKKSIDWAQSAPIKTTFIRAVHWHCRLAIPPEPLSENSEQQRLATLFNEFLQEQGFNDLYERNLKAISENGCYIPDIGGLTTITLKNPIGTVKKDLEESRQEVLKRKSKKIAF